MKTYDQRFAHDMNFIFVVFNQRMRHYLAQNMALKIRSDNKHIETLKRIIPSADFEKRLDVVVNDLDDEVVRKLMKEIWPLVKLTSYTIPCGLEEINAGRAKIYVMNICFNGHNHFLTFSPAEIDCKLSIAKADLEKCEKL